MAGDDDEVYNKKPQRYAEDNGTTFNCICSCKSEAQVTIIKDFAITLLKVTTDGHKASRGLSATAELLVRPPQLMMQRRLMFLL